MYTNSILAVTGVLVATVAAIPRAEFQHHHQHHPKRDLVWVTKYEEVVEVVPVTKTVWVEPGETVPTAYSTDAPESIKPAAYTAPASSSAAKPAVAEYNPPAAVQSEPASAPAYVAPSSSYVAPAAATSSAAAYVAPAPSSTYVAPYVAPAPSSAAASAPAAASSSSPSYSSGGGSSGGQTYSGDFTWYEVGLGACGITSTSTEPVVAVSHVLFDAVSTGNSNTNPLCGQKISIIGKDGNTYTGTIVDRCPSCAEGSLDLSESFFNKVTSNGDGRVLNMKWSMA